MGGWENNIVIRTALNRWGINLIALSGSRSCIHHPSRHPIVINPKFLGDSKETDLSDTIDSQVAQLLPICENTPLFTNTG